MKFSPIPDWSSRRRVALGALVVWLIAFAAAPASWPRLVRTLGDTDDALRLAIVRDLAGGRGWFDQKLVRLQPPHGLYMHWSRLLDGAEAALLKAFSAMLPADRAELALRLVWPLLWIGPLTAAVLLVARRLGGGRAVFLGMVTAALSFHASGEFQPGRIDHHNVQISLCLLALAAALEAPAASSASSWVAAAACGLASAAGLAVGLEALPFLAVIGATLGFSWATRRSSGRALVAYGASLALGAAGLHAIQTPPERLLLPACDALAVNLVGGLAVAGAGLILAALLGARAGPWARATLLAAAGALAATAYLAADPACLHGPMAAVDPEMKAAWLANVREMTPWLRLLGREPALAVNMAAPAVAGLAGWLWLARRREARANPAWLALGALLLVSIPLTLQASRYMQYALWFAAPVTAAALVDLAGAILGGLMIPAVAALAAATLVPGWLVAQPAMRRPQAAPAAAARPADRCTDTAAFRPLAQLPPGLVLSEIDAGPYIVAETPHAVLQAPYHRMGWGVGQARAALGATTQRAEAEVRALGVRYVVDCPAHARQADRVGLPADSLQRALDAGRPPVWLEPLSGPGQPLQVYRVRAAAARLDRLAEPR